MALLAALLHAVAGLRVEHHLEGLARALQGIDELHRVLHAALAKEPALLAVYEEIEQPLVPVLLEM